MMSEKADKKLKITIGIPAHNEEANIENLLRSVFVQKREYFRLDKVYVLCDGCTDSTPEIALKVAKKYKKLIVKNDRKRKGKPQRLNELYKIAGSEVIVSLDADVVLRKPEVIDELVKPFFANIKPGLVWGRSEPLKSKSVVEKMANLGV